MAELGFFGATLEGYGCAGMNNVDYGLVMQEMERGDSGVRSFVSVQIGAVHVSHQHLRQRGAEEKWLPAMAKGEKLGCFGLTEPDAGSNPAAMRTRARREGANTCSTARRCGSPPAPSPTWPSSGPRTRSRAGRFAASWSRPTGPASRAQDIHGKWSLRASVTSSLVAAGRAHSRAKTCCPKATD